MTSLSGTAYQPVRAPRTFRLPVRGLDYHVREWGSSDACSPIVMLHGGRDSSASFQFLVDAMSQGRHVIAPDWRGHGRTQWAAGAYWHSDFLCDLDSIISVVSPDAPVTLIGHSMGGNIAALFAGLRPGRVSRLVILDSLGNTLDKSPVHVLEELRDQLSAQGSPPVARRFADVPSLARRLMQANPRLEEPKALFLTDIAAHANPDGSVGWPHDPTFKRSRPSLHSVADWADVWSRITAPVLCLLSSDPRPNGADGHEVHVRERVSHFASIEVHRLAETSHNLHVDAPNRVADLIETFLRAPVDRPAQHSSRNAEESREHP